MTRHQALLGIVVLTAVLTTARRRPSPLPECALDFDANARLDLTRADDRQRLADELNRIDVIASRFRERIRADPPVTTTSHALRSHATRPQRAFVYCETILRESLMKAHALTPSDLRVRQSDADAE